MDKESRFDREQDQWALFQDLLDRADAKGLGDFSLAEAESFFSLHRLIAASLIQSRHRGLDQARIRYLDSLAKRGHQHLYPADQGQGLRSLALLKGGFACAFRESLKFQGLAWLLLLLGMWIGYRATTSNTEYAYPLLGLMYPAEFVQGLIESKDTRLLLMRAGRESPAAAQTIFFTALFLNNLRAAVVAFVFGVLAGVPTVLMLILNGAILGSVTALFHRSADEINFEFWAWILPHAIPELFAVCVAAAGGLKMGLALIDAADRGRRAALAEAGRACVPLIGLSMFLLFYAALIEAFVRQSTWASPARFFLAAVNLFAIVAYLSFAGRHSSGLNSSGGDRL